MSFLRQIIRAFFVMVALSAMGRVALGEDKTSKECELADHDPDRSIPACSKLLARSPTRVHAEAFHNGGLAWEAKGNLDQAVSDISEGIRLDPQRPYRWQERGEIYARQGKYQQALADITKAIAIDTIPRAFRFHNRAQAYQGLGDLAHAIADFDEAVRLDPVPRSFRFHDRGNALRDAGQYDRALVDYETALKLAPTDASILLDRGRTYARMGNPDSAKTDFDAAATLDPSNSELRHLITMELAALINRSPAVPPRQTSVLPQHGAPTQPTPGSRAQQGVTSESSSGTGFFVGSKQILTNHHVIKDCGNNPIWVSYPERRPEQAYVSARDEINDLALLHTELANASVASFRFAPRLGEQVATYGFPLSGLLSSGGNFTLGNVTSLAGLGDDTRVLQTSTPIQPGNSGGPLLDMTGSVVGVIEYQLNSIKMIEVASNVPQNVNFAIRTAIVTNFLAIKGVSPSLADRGQKALEPADVAEIARRFTVQVSCGEN